jgi:HAMP domain-containing protein/HPt (histidine-containing phosphotransfer) domain-containing protein
MSLSRILELGNKSLLTKVFVGLAVVTITVMGGYAGYQMYRTESSLHRNNAELHGVIVSGALSPLSVALWNYDNDIIASVSKSMFEHGEVQRVQVYRQPNGLPITALQRVSGTTDSKPIKFEGVPFEKLGIGIPANEAVEVEGNAGEISQKSLVVADGEATDHHRITGKLYYQKDKVSKLVGIVVVDYTSQMVLQYISHSKRVVVVFALGSTLVILLISFLFLAKSVIRPISTIAAASLEAAKGKFSLINSITTKDEIGVLAENFNYMMNEIRTNAENREHIIHFGREVSSQVTFHGISDVVRKAAVLFAGSDLKMEIYYSNLCFMNSGLRDGFYPLEKAQDAPDAQPLSIHKLEEVGRRAHATIKILDPRDSACLAVVVLDHDDKQVLEKATPNLRAICNNMASAITTVRLERTLQLLDRRTRELNTIFSNINQGICMVDSSMVVSPEYSKALETILHETNLRSRPFLDILLEKGNVSPDLKSQIQSCFLSAMGEDIMNFDLNSAILPRELTFVYDGFRSFVEVDWIPIAGSDNTVRSIMITLRDVTLIKQLNEQSEATQREMAMMHQVIGQSEDGFKRFMNSSKNYLEESIGLVKSGKLHGEEARLLKRDLHTLKGNSRALGFTFLTDEVQKVESDVAETLKKVAESPSESKNQIEPILERVAKLESALSAYQNLNDEISKRGGGGWNDKFDLVRAAAATCKETLDSMPKGTPQYERMSKTYRQLLAVDETRISTVIRSLGPLVVSLAKELGRKIPWFELKGDVDCVMDPEMTEAVSASITHLIRNSVDHGFTPELNGEIEVVAKWDKENPEFIYRDNGRGLNLEKIRKKAVAMGLLKANDKPVDDVQIAKLIFHSGLSTADKVTAVSGHGVGMDFVAKAGRDVHIEFTGPREGEFRKFEIHFGIVKEKILAVMPTQEATFQTTQQKVAA